jgi:glyoxylase-like metal-dependent hydrolase (beta-lactamase superfamily II)
LEPLPGLTLHRTAGHFDGHAVLHDRARGIVFCGDALKFELNPDNPREALTISAHNGRPASIASIRASTSARPTFAACSKGVQVWWKSSALRPALTASQSPNCAPVSPGVTRLRARLRDGRKGVQVWWKSSAAKTSR